jgi:hypothetical protein
MAGERIFALQGGAGTKCFAPKSVQAALRARAKMKVNHINNLPRTPAEQARVATASASNLPGFPERRIRPAAAARRLSRGRR